MTVAKIYGWSPTDMREREDAFAAAVDASVIKLGKRAVSLFNQQKVVTAAATPVPPVDLGSMAALTGMWKGYVSAELMPMLTDTYLEAANVIWQGIEEAFDEFTPDAVSDVFAEEYLASASNRLVGIGDLVWEKVRQELLVGFSLGEGTQKLATRVHEAAQVSVARANVIARTEANAAANAGSLQQVHVAGLTGTKEWLDTNDERTRCTHKAAGGQTVAVDGTFTLGGPECGAGFSYLRFPGDPTGPPGEVIQCRCSMAFDLELDESTVTAAANQVNTGAMIALMPTAEDANALALDLDGAELASELHVTLLFLGDAVMWSDTERTLLTNVVDELVGRYTAIGTETFSVNIFNPTSDEFDTAVVLGVRGTDTLVALHESIATNVTDVFDDQVPSQHTPWVPHITLAYSDELGPIKAAMKKLGPVVFDRVRVVFAGQITDIPLGSEVTTAAADFIEAEHPRDTKGKFAKKPGAKIVDTLKAIEGGDFSGLKKVSGPKGSNPGGVYKAPDGSHWYVKEQKSVAHAKNEKAAADLYRAAGVGAPEVYVSSDGKRTASRIIPAGHIQLGKVAGGDNSAALSKVREGFAVDALLANWDVAGLSYDNIIFDDNGDPHRIDVGGSLEYRAQGTPKGSAFGVSVDEWNSLRDASKNPQSAALFKNMTSEELQAAVQHVQDLTPEKIREIVSDKKLADKLIKRREDLLKRAESDGVLPTPATDLNETDFSFVDENAVPELDVGNGDVKHPTDVISPAPVDVSNATTVATPEQLSAIWDEVESGDSFGVGDVIATGHANGVPVRLVVLHDAPVISEEFQNSKGEWVTVDSWDNKYTFKNANITGYEDLIDNPAPSEPPSVPTPKVLGPSPEAAKLGLTDEELAALKAQVQEGSDVFDEPSSPAEVWDNLSGMNSGSVVATGTDTNGHHLEIQLEFADDGLPMLVEYQHDPDTGWNKIRMWYDKESFVHADLSEYPMFTNTKLTPTSTSIPSATTPVGPLNNADPQKIWSDVKAGHYPNDTVLASYTDGMGNEHQLIVKPSTVSSGQVIAHQIQFPGTASWKTYDVFSNKVDIEDADLHEFGVGGVPTGTSGPTAKLIPNSTTGDVWFDIQSGKYQKGDILATYTEPDGTEHRLIVSGHGATLRPVDQKLVFGDWMLADSFSTSTQFHNVHENFGIPVGPPTAHTPSTPSVPTVAPSISTINVTVMHPAGSHAALWAKMQNGEFKPGQLLGEYTDGLGARHKLRVSGGSGKNGFVHEVYDFDQAQFVPVEMFTDESEFLAADLAKFMTPKVAPKAPKLSKLTNAVIYGKYKQGDVIATDTTGLTRLVYKDNKIHVQARGTTSESWNTIAIYGKGEAYKNLSTKPGYTKLSWHIGDVQATGGEQLVTSAPTLKAPPSPPPSPAPTIVPVSKYKQVKIKKSFDDAGVKWHTASDKMLSVLVKTQKEFPEYSLAQLLETMDGTTKTKTDPTPFTTKVKKYVSTYVGKAHLKALGVPVDDLLKAGATSGTSTPGLSTPHTSYTPSAPSTPIGTILVKPTEGGHGIFEAGGHVVKAPPEGFKIHTPAEMGAIQDQMAKQYGDLTPAQRSKIIKYTGSYYKTMNACLRKPSKCTPTVKKENEDAIAGMRPLTASVRVTRGTGWGAIPGAEDIVAKHGEAEAIKYLMAQDGRLLVEPGFLSTSSRKTPAFGGPLRFEIDVPEGTPASWVGKISNFKGEDELILAPGLKYRIKKVSPKGTLSPSGKAYHTTLVVLEVVYP